MSLKALLATPEAKAIMKDLESEQAFAHFKELWKTWKYLLLSSL